MSVPYVMLVLSTRKERSMISLDTLGTLFANGYTIVDSPAPTVECLHMRSERYTAPDWDSLAFYTSNYALCDCGWHKGTS